MTPAGIEPATFRFVTQHLNHCTTAVPSTEEVLVNIVDITHAKPLKNVFVTIMQFYCYRLLFNNTVRNITVIYRCE